MRTSEESIKLHVVALEKDDVTKAIVAAAERELAASSVFRGMRIDQSFAPQVLSDGYGGFKIYFRAADPERKTVAA